MANRTEDIFNIASSASRDFFHEVSEGYVPGHSGVYLFGHNDTLTANVSETLWGGSGTWVPPTGASRVNISSSSSADTSSGIGARTVLITGLDSDFNIIRESVTLSGVTNILTNNSYIAINEMLVTSAGASGLNDGIIYANQSSSSLLLNCISKGSSISNSLLYTIPSGFEGHISQLFCSSSKVSSGQASKVTFKGKLYKHNTGVYILGFEDTFDTDIIQNISLTQQISYIIEEQSTVFVNVVSDQSSTVAHGRLYLIQDKTGDTI